MIELKRRERAPLKQTYLLAGWSVGGIAGTGRQEAVGARPEIDTGELSGAIGALVSGARMVGLLPVEGAASAARRGRRRLRDGATAASVAAAADDLSRARMRSRRTEGRTRRVAAAATTVAVCSDCGRDALTLGSSRAERRLRTLPPVFLLDCSACNAKTNHSSNT